MIGFRLIRFQVRKVSALKQDRWIAVTAGVGTLEFEGAALRVKKDLGSAGVVDKVVAVLTKDLPNVCPRTSKIYSDHMNPETRGFGFMSWKAEIVNAAFNGYWGEFEGVIWIDGGCEVNINPISKLRFRFFQNFAQRHGVTCFSLATQEIEYTKRDIFDLFPKIDPLTAGPQIQTTWMMLHGTQGKRLANEWFDTVCKGTHLLDLQPSKNVEFDQFVENRYDQSTFSMVCKNNNVPVMRYRPTAGRGSLVASARSVFHPLWTARNRTSKSIKKRFHQIFEV